MDEMKKARELLSAEILHNFIGRITGAGVSRIIGSNPENILLVGKLMSTEDSDNQSMNTSKTFIASIGVDSYISKEHIDEAVIKLTPQGDFYYRAIPTLEEQRQAMLKEINERGGYIEHKSFDEVIEKHKENPECFSSFQVKLIPVYKKISINANSAQICFKPGELLNETGDFGFAGEKDYINSQINTYLQELQDTINADKEAMRKVITEPIKVNNLLSSETYRGFLQKYSNSKVEQQRLNWKIYFDIQIRKIGQQYLVSCFLVNNSIVLYSMAHKSRRDDKFTIETLFNSGIRVDLENAAFCPIELDSFADDYKYDKAQYALGNNCSVEFLPAENALQTNHLPLYKQYRLVTNDRLSLEFIDLANNPIGTLELVLIEMKSEFVRWKQYQTQKNIELTDKGREKLAKEIQGFMDEISNFESGINALRSYPPVRKSFVQMNMAFAKTSKDYSSWRLFQIVFIVSMIPDIVACDQDIMPDDEKARTHLSDMALLYFPTGGGKTEAFLGVLVFNLFFDRHRGKKCGVTSILRYPLRLLSVQQVQRLADILAQAELIRRNDSDIASTECFSLGYFVGDNNTPNSMSEKEYVRYREMTQFHRDEQRILDICPFCGKQTVHLRADETLRRLIHYCDNPECLSEGDLPIYIVDTEIYRFLPSAIISTVDKLALVGCNPSFRSILNGADLKCPIHGYTSKRKCLEPACKLETQDFESIDMYDPAPTLFIQDELHLIRESLGTYAAHYESFLKYYINNVSKSKRDLKIIGATATISSYREQVYHLYRRNPVRFPCESPLLEKNFYAFVDKTDLQRHILGYAPYGKAIVNSVVYSLKYMREAVYEYYKEPQKILDIPGINLTSKEDALELLKDYWIFLEYNNVKRDGNNVDGAIKTPVNEELSSDGIIPFITRAMTGDESFQDIREVLAEIENSDNVYEGTNLITATSMISHGVDADRFNVMFFYGIPGNMAEYIQAYSRTGRRHTSIVVDLIRPTRETDQSYLKNFISIHKYKDLLVEPVPINRWASKAIDNTLPGIFTALLLTCYDPELQYMPGTLFLMKNIKKAIKDNLLNKETIKGQLYIAFGCDDTDGTIEELGDQYRQKISCFVNDAFVQIVDRSWGDENIFDGFRLMGCRIMNSLRDTDAQLIIELD